MTEPPRLLTLAEVRAIIHKKSRVRIEPEQAT